MTTVTPETEKKLRDAMQRLLTGKVKRTDGRLIKTNLHIEAGVSRATMNRAAVVLAEWDSAVGTASTPRDAQLVGLQETVSNLKKAVEKLRRKHCPQAEEPGCRDRDRRTQRPAPLSPRRRADRHRHTPAEGSGSPQALAIMTSAVGRKAPISSAKVHLSQSIGVLRLSNASSHTAPLRCRLGPPLPPHGPLIVENPRSNTQTVGLNDYGDIGRKGAPQS